ncbi:serine hydrolase [Winogradskyella sp.]|uniref:serine hydrolase domain-containing protein n=1 Tax=Winogradskyella sp. TaxID=1883156 RepID=UPI00261E4647|nr:serine hydrolase domain-containing protein [Winogradskyella sp.]
MINSKPYILFFYILLIGITLDAQNETILVSDDVAQSVEKLANALIKQSHIPGISIAVSKDEKLIYAKGFGYANIEENIKMSPATQLRTASVAKVITATAIGHLLTDGKLDLDEPIKTYIPYIDKTYENLTSRQLAAHTSGLEHRPKGNNYKKKHYNSIKTTVQLMKKPLLFTPDTNYSYSTYAFNLLAAVIEGASGMDYMDYLEKKIFKPLHMTQTYAENINTLTSVDAKLYYIKNKKLKSEKLTNGSYKIPGAGFRSTPSDLVKMMSAYTNNLISKEVVNEMFRSHKLNNGELINVGIAWRKSIDPFENKVIEHAGNWLGARTVISYYPEHNLSISIMINASCQLLIEETAHIFANIFLNETINRDQIKLDRIPVKVTFNGEEKETYNGELSLDSEGGFLTSQNDGFLKSNPIFRLNGKNDYCMATAYGLLYLNINSESEYLGNVYAYYNRLSKNPQKDQPIVTIE